MKHQAREEAELAACKSHHIAWLDQAYQLCLQEFFCGHYCFLLVNASIDAAAGEAAADVFQFIIHDARTWCRTPNRPEIFPARRSLHLTRGLIIGQQRRKGGWLTWLPDGDSQILRSYVFGPLFGPSGLKDNGSATLHCKIWSLPFLGLRPHALHPGAIQGKEGIKFCHLATLN